MSDFLKRTRLFFHQYSFLSGLTGPGRALKYWLIILSYLFESMFGVIFVAVAGKMISIVKKKLCFKVRLSGFSGWVGKILFKTGNLAPENQIFRG
jgi:hypothetical protein